MAKIKTLYEQVSSKNSFSLILCFWKNKRRLLCAEGGKAVLPVLPQCLPLATRSLVGTDSFCSRLQMNKIDLPNMKSKHANILILQFFSCYLWSTVMLEIFVSETVFVKIFWHFHNCMVSLLGLEIVSFNSIELNVTRLYLNDNLSN